MEDKVGFGTALKNMFVGIVKPELYIHNGAKGKAGPAVFAAFIMSILLYLVIFFIPYNNMFGGGRLADAVDNAIGDFTLTNEGFFYDDAFEWSDEEGLSYISIDTSLGDVDSDEVREFAQREGYTTVFMITSQDIISYNGGQMQVIKCRELYEALSPLGSGRSFGKQDILDIINRFDTPVLVTVYVVKTIIGFIGDLIMALLIGAVGLLIASMKNYKVSFGTTYKAALYIRIIWHSVVMVIAAYVWPAATTLRMIGVLIAVVYMFIAISRYSKENPYQAAPAYSGMAAPMNEQQGYGSYGQTNQQSYNGYGQTNQQSYNGYGQMNQQSYNGYGQTNQQSYNGYGQTNQQSYNGYGQADQSQNNAHETDEDPEDNINADNR